MTPHLEGTLTYATAETGGRRSPVATGYQGRIGFDGVTDFAALHAYEKTPMVVPGGTATVRLMFAFPEQVRPRPEVGAVLFVREGARVVATGVVTRVLPGW